MTMQVLTLILLSVVLPASIFPQVPLNRDPQNIVDPTGIMKVLTPPIEVEGTTLMFDDWQLGTMYLAEGKIIPQMSFNYDILNHMFSVRIEKKEYSLNPLSVDSVQIPSTKQTLVNPLVLEAMSSDLMLLIIYRSSHLNLFRKTTVEVIKPTYNELLNVGSRNFQVDKDRHYLLWDKDANQITELHGKKKELKSLENGEKVTSFVRNQHLDLKNESDLIEVIKYYEQLTF